MSGLLIFVLIICLLCWLLPKFDKAFGAKSASTTVARTPSKSEIQKKLDRLVYGDQVMADRLFRQARLRHPDRSEQWIWEKVVHDLERDRGYR